jgi:hypothetical protein
MPDQIRNYGLIYNPVLRDEDYRFGAYNGVIKRVLRADKNWEPNRPTPESQAHVYFDDFGCVTHSHVTSIAAVFDRQIELGMISVGNMQWLSNNGYFDEFGKINFNDRFTIYNGKTICFRGAWQNVVADAIRDFGLTPQTKWNYTNKDFTTCTAFIQKPPQFMFDLGVEFKKRFLLNFELVSANNKASKSEARLYSPLQVIVVAWYKNAQGLYYNPNNNFNHAVVEPNDFNKIWDSYSDYDDTPFEKELVDDYVFGNWAYVWFVNEIIINEENMIFYKEKGNSAVYQLGKDGKHYPINSGETFKRLYGEFADNKIIEKDSLNPKGERLGLVI